MGEVDEGEGGTWGGVVDMAGMAALLTRLEATRGRVATSTRRGSSSYSARTNSTGSGRQHIGRNGD